jgi:AGZA family xanthine/uracil permease-like MFS transporter
MKNKLIADYCLINQVTNFFIDIFFCYYYDVSKMKNIKTEIIAGITTFMTMSYIIFVNPAILEVAGIPKAPTITATCLAAAIPTILMGIFTNYPFALAPGMGLNAFLAYSVCKKMNIPWQVGMAIIFIEGVIITILVLTRIRISIMNSIPMNLKKAIGVGIGLFITFIGLKEAGIIASDPSTFVTLGNFSSKYTLISIFGLLITILLITWKINGALLLGIIITTIISIFFGIATCPKSVISFPSFETFAGFIFGLKDAIKFSMWSIIFAFLISDFFDTMGTVIAISEKAGFLKNGELPRLNRILLIDSLAAVIGGIFSASSSTTYVESAAGIAANGKTGLVSIVVGILFLFALFFSPLVSIVPSVAVAPCLILVGYFMMLIISEIDWENFDESFPCFLTIISMPLTSSISHGIGLGFISYTLIKMIQCKFNEVHPLMYIISLFFGISFSPLIPK